MADTNTVDRLFVSAFISICGLEVRQNKLLRSRLIEVSDSDYALLQDFMTSIYQCHHGSIVIEDLLGLFESVISPADRIVSGAVYTPNHVRKEIIDTCLYDYAIERLENIRVADISCGCGGFLMDVALYIHERSQKSFADIYSDNIYGIDIQQYSVERTKILLSLLALLHGEDANFDFNILQSDTLDYCTIGWDRQFDNFDVIVGNPPYVCSRNVSDTTKNKMLRYEVCHSGHPDLYLPFFQIAVDMLCPEGRLGLITMNSFIRSINGRAVREFFSHKGYDISIVDFRGHQIFRKNSTYTCLFFLTKSINSAGVHYTVLENGDLNQKFEYDLFPYKTLDNKKGWTLNYFNEVRKIESVGTPIAKYCQSRHGIATLSNKTYIFNPSEEDGQYYYLLNMGKLYPIEKGICRDVINSNKLNSEILFEDIIEKLIYPYYINDSGKAVIMPENEIKAKFPKAYAYLNSQRQILSRRDKNKTESYPAWYAYGRTQSLVLPRYKLFFPKFANKSLKCVLVDNEKLMLYNGMAFVSNKYEELLILKRILESKIFWRYIVSNAKPYASDYYSLSGVDIKNFGIPILTSSEKKELLLIKSKEEIDTWLIKYYT